MKRIHIRTLQIQTQPLELNALDMPTCVVPVTMAGKQVRVRVWDDHCQGYDQGDEVAQWLSTFLEEVRVWCAMSS